MSNTASLGPSVDSPPSSPRSSRSSSSSSSSSHLAPAQAPTSRVLLDPVLSVPIPPPHQRDVTEAHQSHLSEAHRQFSRITAPSPSPPSVRKTAHRLASLRPPDASSLRSANMDLLRAKSAELRETSDVMLAEAPAHVRSVLNSAGSLGSHPALLAWCLEQIGWHDKDLLRDLLRGFPLLGDIPVDSRCPHKHVRRATLSQEDLATAAPDISMSAQQRHSARPFTELDLEILRQTHAEAALGRMSKPQRLDALDHRLLTRRFGVSQLDSKGRLKLRCIDDFAESQVNSASSVTRAIRMGRLTDLDDVVHILTATGHPLSLLKSDFSSAYRGCPVLGAHLQFGRVLLKDDNGNLLTSDQYAMPFGAVSAVYAWDRLGGALTAILQHFLVLPCSRYVDDLFWADYSDSSESGRSSALELVSLLGFTLAEDKTPPAALTQDVLGISTSLAGEAGSQFLRATVEPRKLEVWLTTISSSISSRQLPHGDAVKLAGRLSFAAWALWGQVARSHLRRLYDHVVSGSCTLSSASLDELRWWRDRLSDPSSAQRLVPRQPGAAPVVLYTDAEGSSGCGAVLSIDGAQLWFQAHIPPEVTSALAFRRTQILAYETLTVWAALSAFRRLLSGRVLLLFIDNKSSLSGIRKGSSSKADIHAIISLIWSVISIHGMSAHLRWVPSKLNLSDLPSRGKAPICGSRVPLTLSWLPVLNSLSEVRDLILLQ